MKTIAKLLLFVVLACGMCQQSYAQTPDMTDRGMQLSEEEKEEFQQRIVDLVTEFQGYLEKIANSKNGNTVRQSAMKSALNLFIGKGASYTLEGVDGHSTTYDPVKMWTSSKYNSRLRSQFMTSYLNNLIQLGNTYIIKIQGTDVVRVDNINQLANGRYAAVAYFVQKYYRYSKEGRLLYSDETTKKVQIYINPVEVGDGIVWKAYMGDVYVVDTK